MKQKFHISGMSCAACAARVENAVAALRGVHHAEVNLLANVLAVDFDETLLSEDEIIAAVQTAGYGATLQNQQENPVFSQEETLKRRFWVSFCFLLPIFYISMGQMLGLPLTGFLGGVAGRLQALLTLPVLWMNREIFINGFACLCRRAPNMNSLIALGSSAAVLYSVVGLFQTSTKHLYFESAAMILTLITLGKYLEGRAKRKTTGALEGLLKLAPQKATRLEKGQEVIIPAAQIRVGDVLVVKAGMSVPADGVIRQGYGALDEAALTGESLPVDKQAGAVVHAGTINTTGYFEFTVTHTAGDTLLAQIITLVEEASASKAPIGRLADKVSGVFVPIVIVLALLTTGMWLWFGTEVEFALSAAVAVLVISCPCALGLATPTAIMVGMGTGARHGILFKSAAVLEMARQVQVILLDKTGTLTQGQPEVAEVFLAATVSQEDFWRVVVSAESQSSHPLARAMVQAPQALTAQRGLVEQLTLWPGAGLTAQVDGQKVCIGNQNLLQQQGISVCAEMQARQTAWAAQGKTVLYAAKEGALLGMLALADSLKPDAAAAVRELQKMGLEIILLTGDQQATARAVAQAAGITQVVAQVLPQEKEKQVRLWQEQGKKVAMVGDGINDAPALARADVGMTLGAGTDVALETADIVLMKNDLSGIAAALQLSRAVMVNIKENLFWAFIYNICGIPLAAGVFYPWLGWQLSPLFAAAAMSLSSVCVVSNALRLRSFNPYKNLKQELTVMTRIMTIEGMMCAHCAAHVKEALEKLGVQAEVSLDKKQAIVKGNAPSEALKKAVESAGYKVLDIE